MISNCTRHYLGSTCVKVSEREDTSSTSRDVATAPAVFGRYLMLHPKTGFFRVSRLEYEFALHAALNLKSG